MECKDRSNLVTDGFVSLVKSARRIGKQDRLLWLTRHDRYPEQMFDTDVEGEAKEEVEILLETTIDRLVLKCQAIDYMPTKCERRMINFAYLDELYVGPMLKGLEKDFLEAAPEEVLDKLYELTMKFI